ncbi:MAG TPA: T9SS type A sorting domain-containing protein [Bacteroidales bacterium]|nr:T9SS type A sorting domain-containing protein [Bacteroidales bacterium]
MKKNLLILAILIVVSNVHGQTNFYHSFPDSAIWRVDCDANDPFQYPYHYKEYYYYNISGDTVINSYIYKKINRSYDSVYVISWSLPTDPPNSHPPCYVGALRDDSAANKVFFVYAGTNTDSLLFDYNIAIGDTVKGLMVPYGIYNLVVQSTDSILIDGNYRKRWIFNQTSTNHDTYFIQGIGSNSGLIEPGDSYSVNFTDRYLVCVKDCTSTLFVSNYVSDIGCNLILSSSDNESLSNNYSCYPNPFSRQISIHSDKALKDANITVYNLSGQIVKHIDNVAGQTFILHSDNIANGIYFLQMTEENQILIKEKIIILKE